MTMKVQKTEQVRAKPVCKHQHVKQIGSNKKLYQCIDCGIFVKR